MTQSRPAAAALAALIILQSVMLMALYAGVPPHPPAATPLFGIGPFLGMALSAAAAALVLGPLNGPAGRALTALAAALALVSFGPQKYADPAFAQIWPAVLSAQAAVAMIGHALWRSRKAAR
ncbi:hypothetical protein [Roseibium litorale]|uniref:Uncharacterized protein n=1 Tax=Roseibium litorale TaxID=2803841 RepID=A0ABR9CTH2_9HYPH|nr:hypothetical protein [Roseibium litorale]MBD8894180.1 hypothetical protein [Roseibium litorale]